MSRPGEDTRRWVRQIAAGVVIASLAWSAWGGHTAVATGLGRDVGRPAVVLPIASTAPCSKESLRPTSNRTRDSWQHPKLWLATDCTTEANRIPTNLQATGTPSTVTLGWTAPGTAGVTKYRVERSVKQGPFLEIAQPTGTSYTDNAVTGTPATTYVYRVRADYGGTPPLLSAPSNIDVATTITFTDDHTLAGKTVLGQHVTELRSAVGAVCGTAGESMPTWTTDPTITPQQTVIKKAHIEELRAKASECLAAVGVAAAPYNPNLTITAGVTEIKKEHVQELRDAVH